MKSIFPAILLFILFSCDQSPKTTIPTWVPYDQSGEIAENADHPSRRMQYKLIQSKVTDRNDVWTVVQPQIADFSEEEYETLKPLILEKNIPTLQASVSAGDLTYEKITKWYLYRIAKYENDSSKALNAIIAINPNAVKEAKAYDESKSDSDHPLFGLPILLKDNVNADGMPTTAGAHVLQNNYADNAFIVDRIEEKGGIILGKVNLSEWANFFCNGCPNGFTTLGGQTLNPYGPRIHDTGGSSSGSGASIAANYAVAAVGTETSGSILSPSSSSSLVGLKPTVGLLSRGGIVPISSTLDTPGPMTRSIVDNAILLSAMTGEDPMDPATEDNPKGIDYLAQLKAGTFEGMRFGVFKSYLEDSIYHQTIHKIEELGGEIVEFDQPEVELNGFGDLLSADMRLDLTSYLENYGAKEISIRTVEGVVAYNKEDSAMRMPYGQGRFESILEVNLSGEEHALLKDSLKIGGLLFFQPMEDLDLDFVLSINNYSAGYAAAAKYPCLTIPMGYRDDGQPMGITFIARPFQEDKLLSAGYIYEQATQERKMPNLYP